MWDSVLSFKVEKDIDNTPQATEENFDFDVPGMQSLLCYLLNEKYKS